MKTRFYPYPPIGRASKFDVERDILFLKYFGHKDATCRDCQTLYRISAM